MQLKGQAAPHMPEYIYIFYGYNYTRPTIEIACTGKVFLHEKQYIAGAIHTIWL